MDMKIPERSVADEQGHVDKLRRSARGVQPWLDGVVTPLQAITDTFRDLSKPDSCRVDQMEASSARNRARRVLVVRTEGYVSRSCRFYRMDEWSNCRKVQLWSP